MAYVNVAEWSPDQVTEWLKGLDNVITPYINSFLNNEVKGQQLLNLRSDDLEHLGVYTLGHQELILEAVEHLRNFHYELDRENLQLLALRLSCASHSLYNELLLLEDTSKVETQTMADVANVISTIKPLVCWLDRSPFSGQIEYSERKTELLRLSLEMATCALRDRFAERPVAEIKDICYALAGLADRIIQDMTDPMVLQPASLNLATLKKRENDLGFFILPSFHAVHQISEIKFGSPAHTSGRIEEGDEIVQVNYQTVVGWQRKKVLALFQEPPLDVLLTLKKRPRHTKIYGQIYMKPYRLPSKKRASPYNRWHDSIPSPRLELLTIPDFEMPLPRVTSSGIAPQLPPTCSSDSDSCSSVSDSDGGQQPGLGTRVYPLKPRPVLQRRNTITGASPTSKGPSASIEQFWRELKTQASYKHSGSSFIQPSIDIESNMESLIRDKSASCGHGLELSPRPTTVIGLSKVNKHQSSKKAHSSNKSKHMDEVGLDRDKSDSKVRKKIGVRFEDQVDVDKKTSKVESKNEDLIVINRDNSLHVKNDETLKFIDDNEDEVQDRSNLIAETKCDSGAIVETFNIDVRQKVSTFENKLNENTNVKISPEPKPTPKTRTLYSGNESEIKIEEKRKPPEIPPKPNVMKKPAVPPRNMDRISQLRGRLDKSHSTPAYDTTENSENENFSLERISKNSQLNISTTSDETNDSKSSECDSSQMTDSMEDRLIAEKMSNILENINSSLMQRRQKETETLNKSPEQKKFEKSQEAYEIFVPLFPKETSNEDTYRNKNSEAPKPPPRPVHTLGLDSSPKNKTPSPGPLPSKIGEKSSPDIKSDALTEIKPKSENKEIREKAKYSMNDKCDIKVTANPVKAMVSKGKAVKKKNSILAKRRKVSVKDVSPGEIQGHLYQRIRNKNTQNVNWEKRWFVLNGGALYGFQNKDSSKADFVVFLSGFTVSLANEVKSRYYAFKVYHTGTAFYFSADNYETMSTWIDFIRLATLESTGKGLNDSNLYSETDDSDEEEKQIKPTEKTVQESHRKFGSLKKFTSRKHSDASNENHGSTSLDRKYLRFFHTNSASKANKSQNLPVPTAQFRSYRKVVPPSIVINKNLSPQSTNLVTNIIKNNNSKVQEIINEQSKSETSSTSDSQYLKSDDMPPKLGPKSAKIVQKPKPINYIHASNPSLCDFTDFKVPLFAAKPKTLNRNDNLAGFITLEQFMLNRQEEERKQNLFLSRKNDDDNEARSPSPPASHSRKASTSERSRKNSCEESEHKKLGESLSYPYKSESRPDKSTICRKYSDGVFDRERKASYEESHSKNSNCLDVPYRNDLRKMSVDSVFENHPYVDDLESDFKLAYDVAQGSKTLGSFKKPHPPTPKHKNKIVRQHSLNSADKKLVEKHSVFRRGESPEKFWLDSLRRNDKVFASTPSSSSQSKLKSATQYMPMNVSFGNEQKLNPKFAFELNLDEKTSKTSKFKNFFSSGHKSDSEKPPKEKTLLGSPRLHRTIFRRNQSPTIETDWRGDFSQATSSVSSVNSPVSVVSHACAVLPAEPHPGLVHPPPPDYPGLEYPPVFEPETYSLTNPACSLLRKSNKNFNNK